MQVREVDHYDWKISVREIDHYDKLPPFQQVGCAKLYD
jgi:hypothetical protein